MVFPSLSMSRARTSMKWDVYQVKTTILRCIFAFDIEVCFLDSPTVCRCYVFLWVLKARGGQYSRKKLASPTTTTVMVMVMVERERERERDVFFPLFPCLIFVSVCAK